MEEIKKLIDKMNATAVAFRRVIKTKQFVSTFERGKDHSKALKDLVMSKDLNGVKAYVREHKPMKYWHIFALRDYLADIGYKSTGYSKTKCLDILSTLKLL